MSIKLSTGLRNSIMTGGSLKAGVDGGVIYIYSGTPPATADDALSGNTLLATISNNGAGTGITMDAAAVGGVLGKNPAEVWRGLIGNTGSATFYRFAALTDDGLASTVEKRIQGTIAALNADLIFANPNFVSGNYRNIDTFNLALPTA